MLKKPFRKNKELVSCQH